MKSIFLLAGVAVASPANVKLGEQIGALLSKGLSEDPAGFQAAFNSATANQPVLSNDAVEAVARNHLSKSAFLGTSKIDYSSCPVGWSRQGDICVAPEGFFACSKRFNTRILNDALKAKFAQKCGVEFPKSFAKYFDEATENPILNLHVKESSNEASTNAAVEASQRAQLAALESEEATTKEFLADLLGKVNLQIEATARKMSGKQTSFLGVVSDVQREAQNMLQLNAELDTLRTRLGYNMDKGGYTVYNGLIHALNLVSEPNAQGAMILKMIGAKLRDLMRRESTPDSIRNLAGSIMTHISNAPVASSVASSEGSSGHINIIVPRPSRVYHPDAAILAMKAGADAADIA